MDALATKQNGVHYTPPELAGFLARQIVSGLSSSLLNAKSLSILDPACGDGELLESLVSELGRHSKARLNLRGFEIDSFAANTANSRLRKLERVDVSIKEDDFLESDLFDRDAGSFDIVIANPPYVRTQTLGGIRSQALASKFGLTGRVDLYHAFAVAITQVLRQGGSLGLLTSNRFLSVRSGKAMRSLLREEFDLQSIFDLGDTRLFEAAVLPAIVVGRKKNADVDGENRKLKRNCATKFHRIYVQDGGKEIQGEAGVDPGASFLPTALEAIEDKKQSGQVRTTEGVFAIQRGELISADASVWTLGNSQTKKWLGSIHANQICKFGDVSEIKVGIKTTADSVFIADDWSALDKLSLIHI